MSKPPKEQARDYVWHNYGEGDFNEHNWDRSAEEIWLAGYKAAKDQLADTSKVMPQWISVKERLPEIADGRFISDDVLWISRYGELHVSCLEQLRHEIYVDWGEAGLLKLDQVTHWMPLPAPPEEEK